MGQAELTQKILERLTKQVAFGGKTKRKTTEGEVILNCPIINGQGDLSILASDLTHVFINYIEEEGLKQIKSIIKDMVK